MSPCCGQSDSFQYKKRSDQVLLTRKGNNSSFSISTKKSEKEIFDMLKKYQK